MTSQVIDTLGGARYVLEGRIITMGPAGVVPRGAIYIEAGEIKAVQPTTQAPLEGFGTAPRIKTGDSIYPGLIELHNHLSYNAMPLWDVPKRYGNNGQWRNHEDYRRLITKPSQVLGRTAGVVEALVRFVECRCLLGGVTTSQGITLASAGQIRTFYKGLVRNVEQAGDPKFPAAGTRIANVKPGEAADYLAGLQGQTCYLQHLSEGRDPTARQWFLNLRLPAGDWAITDGFCGIHSTALQADDFDVLQSLGGSIVWSPLSNYLLYGQTLDIRAAKDSGVLMGIGSDWAPSGSKNLLGELKLAWLDSQQRGGIFTAEEIAAMATINAARILKWDAVLGSIEPGKRADFVVIDGQTGDDYMRLISARETEITLVVIDGVARVGKKSFMQRFGPGTEEIRVGSAKRIVYLDEPTAHPLVAGLSLTEATNRLREAMHNLPDLAARLDSATANNLTVGSMDETGVTWQVVLDFEDEASDMALGADGLAAHVQPMELAGITAVDDRDFLPGLQAARNLPEFVKSGLPPLYGQPTPPPGSASFLLEKPETRPPELLSTTRELRTFLRTWGELDLEGRKTIADQAANMLEQSYVHLPLKRAMYAIDPIQRLRLLRYRLEQASEGELPPEIEFHNELTRIFGSLRDLHTVYRLPAPFRGKIAWLPFLIEEYWEGGQQKYMVSKTVGDPGPKSFRREVEVLHWNGMTIQQAVAQNADRQGGGNPAARHARGLNSLTIRPLAAGLPPQEEWVTLRYRGLDGKIREYTQAWLVFEPDAGIGSLSPDALLREATAVGLDAQTDDIQGIQKLFYAWDVALREVQLIVQGKRDLVENSPVETGGVPTYQPTVFRATRQTTAHGSFGYIRIFTFNVPDADEFVQEFVRLAEQLPEDGLIIDVRGNGGGLIYAAERLLQVLTPRHIEPERAQFINTPLNLHLCRHHAPSTLIKDLDLRPWVGSIAQSVETAATYSLGYPITPEDDCNDTGQKYYGPVLLITDALCYSATDIFAAGFQDHDIGPILGISGQTGAGGANVWSYRLLRLLQTTASAGAADPIAPKPLPMGADFRVAVRRTVRVGANAGAIVEDLGIRPSAVHRMTRDDLLHGNRDLIAKATEMLAALKPHGIKVALEPRSGRAQRARITTRNVTRLDLLVNNRPRASYDIRQDETEIDLAPVVENVTDPYIIEFVGFEGDQLVARQRINVA